jgi:hypothetical protein
MCFSYNCISQENLVINPYLEDYSECPSQMDQLYLCTGWSKFGYVETPNYFNTCAVGNSNTFIPHYWGYQLPLSGNGYINAGVIMMQGPYQFLYITPWLGTNIQSREAIKGSLTRPLNPVPHVIEFYVNMVALGDEDPLGSGLGTAATDAFDLILLTDNDTVFNSVSPYIDNYEIIEANQSGNIINDTMNWVKISTCFIPKGGERFFAIGAFRDTTEINIEFHGISNSNNYVGSYYFENFSIYECDTCCFEQFPYIDNINISNNPGNNSNPTIFTIKLTPNSSAVFEIYDSSGRLIFKNSYYEPTNIFTIPSVESGVYYYSLYTSNNIELVGKVVTY